MFKIKFGTQAYISELNCTVEIPVDVYIYRMKSIYVGFLNMELLKESLCDKSEVWKCSIRSGVPLAQRLE